MPRALITGASGQDGVYLMRLLQARGYGVHALMRSPPETTQRRLQAVGGAPEAVAWVAGAAGADALTALPELVKRVAPDEIYHLAGQSSVGASFADPAGTWRSHLDSALALLEALRVGATSARLFLAGSIEIFDPRDGAPINSATPLAPRSPYAAAKASLTLLAREYRRAYGLPVAVGHLSNHESPLRPERFVTRKVTDAAARIAGGSGERLSLGNLHVARDWGWAEEYVEAMWRLNQPDSAAECVIASGTSITLEAFVAAAFDQCGLHWREHVDVAEGLKRAGEAARVQADAAEAERLLGWRAQIAGEQVARRLADAALAALRRR
ncbi:GDP-mannose 4,6-dehydratase [Magnetofaba australis]|uniref:GDP-mannose 4,6-dehydratase n=1 Tax=Magnetofaba australis IT-1 TaxID=1434232 RepID=A0A1Y2K3S3_9PROT|nr:GDP-mannose 4,6-dehydratase [Magnetofaba australis]OSM04037.1 putative GDPmannose 4,6-dehydratase [Magnetofaba australis IT-1]